MLQCTDGAFYVGITRDIERRFWEHETGYFKNCFTYKRRPVILVYTETFEDVNQAMAWKNN